MTFTFLRQAAVCVCFFNYGRKTWGMKFEINNFAVYRCEVVFELSFCVDSRIRILTEVRARSGFGEGWWEC